MQALTYAHAPSTAFDSTILPDNWCPSFLAWSYPKLRRTIVPSFANGGAFSCRDVAGRKTSRALSRPENVENSTRKSMDETRTKLSLAKSRTFFYFNFITDGDLLCHNSDSSIAVSYQVYTIQYNVIASNRCYFSLENWSFVQIMDYIF